MKIRSKSLLLRLITPLSLLSVATVLTISVSTYFSARETLKQSLFDRLSVATTLKEEEINQWFQSQRNDILLLANLPEIQTQTLLLSGSDSDQEAETESDTEPDEEAAVKSNLAIKQAARKQIASYLQEITKFKSDFAEISILADNGTVLFSTNQQLENTIQPLDSQITYFADASVEITPIFYTSPITETTAITFATPILDNAKNRISILSVTLDLRDVDSLIQESTGLGKTGATYLVGQL